MTKEEISTKEIKPYRAGIRAQIVERSGKMIDDFLVREGERSIHVLNAVSPGMTSSLAFSKYIVENYIISDRNFLNK